MRLTEPQIKALKKIVRFPGTMRDVPFRTGEVLRRLGLVERQTYHILKYDWANKDRVITQCEAPAKSPIIWHEWYPTLEGEELVAPQSAAPVL